MKINASPFAIARVSAVAGLLVCSAVLPAAADATANLQTKVDAAMRGAKSFVVTTRYPAKDYSSTLVYVAPNRSRVAVAIAATTTDVVIVGATAYSSKNGASFERAPVPPEESARFKTIGSVKVVALRGDVKSDGVTYGTFDTTLPLGAALTLTCLYDKKNYRLARCASDAVTQTYANYDDPKNTVEAPPDFVEAPKTPAPNGF